MTGTIDATRQVDQQAKDYSQDYSERDEAVANDGEQDLWQEADHQDNNDQRQTKLHNGEQWQTTHRDKQEAIEWVGR